MTLITLLSASDTSSELDVRLVAVIDFMSKSVHPEFEVISPRQVFSCPIKDDICGFLSSIFLKSQLRLASRLETPNQISNIQTANGVPCLHKSLAESHPHLPIFSFSVIFLPPSKKFSVCGSNIDKCFEALPQQVCLWSKGGWTQSKRTTKSSNENQFRNEWGLALLYHRLDLTIICTI